MLIALTTGKLNASALVHLDWSYPALLRSDEQRGPDAPGFIISRISVQWLACNSSKVEVRVRVPHSGPKLIPNP